MTRKYARYQNIEVKGHWLCGGTAKGQDGETELMKDGDGEVRYSVYLSSEKKNADQKGAVENRIG